MQPTRTRTRTRVLRRTALAAVALSLAAAVPAAAAQGHAAHTTHDTLATRPGAPGRPVHSVGAVHGDHTTGAAAPQAAAPVRSGDPQSTVDRVADFYGAYVDAVWDGQPDSLRAGLRAHYLTSGFLTKLTAWEQRNHADGVLRAQDSPIGWQVTTAGSGAGHAFSTVRLTWGNPARPSYTYLEVQSDLATKKISDIEEQEGQ